ncbi:hypothetical protein B9Z55_027700 [Caenorhabditis nigoni]|uniref:Uncharacterized protein n=1 Tax=Caenorhabditis nigoni TaxID=1611254 RepID=A0A2G5SF00_9PELO|nr:hypothetical protein B9Z55_027700 [Caenorhabditis nigoni]
MCTFQHLLFSAETPAEVHHRVLTNSPVLCFKVYSRYKCGESNPTFVDSTVEIFLPILLIITVREVCEAFIPKARAS